MTNTTVNLGVIAAQFTYNHIEDVHTAKFQPVKGVVYSGSGENTLIALLRLAANLEKHGYTFSLVENQA